LLLLVVARVGANRYELNHIADAANLSQRGRFDPRTPSTHRAFGFFERR